MIKLSRWLAKTMTTVRRLAAPSDFVTADRTVLVAQNLINRINFPLISIKDYYEVVLAGKGNSANRPS